MNSELLITNYKLCGGIPQDVFVYGRDALHSRERGTS